MTKEMIMEGVKLILQGIGEDVNDLLFDPQTSGGLLLSVPAKKSDLLLAKLAQKGVKAALIGEVLPEQSDGLSLEVF